MLQERGIDYRYREYTEEPLSEDEIRRVLARLDMGARDVLRKNDRATKELGLDGTEDEGVLIGHMTRHPTLLQRPIGVLGEKAVLGRPAERLLDIL